MKKMIVTVAFLAIANFGMAQDATFKTDVLKVIQMSGGAASMELAKDQVAKMVPEAKRAAFIVEFNATLPSLYDKLADIYMKEYTHDEIREMIKFYETPVGKKITAKSGTIAEQAAKAGETWGQQLQPLVMKYMQ
jgi:uncharacterized protein